MQRHRFGLWAESLLEDKLLLGPEEAAIASLVETCKLNAPRPASLRADVIARIVAGHPGSQLVDRLPWAYAPQPLKAEA